MTMNHPPCTVERIAQALADIRQNRPLVHNITNYVVMNSTANALLALGASPVMAHAVEEVAELARLSGALVLNIGTLSPPWITAMFTAGDAARDHGVPIVLDPVGAGATRLRTETARQLLEQLKPQVVRGNPSEILALAGDADGARGVDTRHTVAQARDAADALAREFAIAVAVTGAEDYVSDGTRRVRIRNGHPLMTRVTGTGCAATAIIGAFLAVEPDGFAAAVAALVVFGVAAELAGDEQPGPGTFQVRLLDALSEIDEAQVRRCARFVVEA